MQIFSADFSGCEYNCRYRYASHFFVQTISDVESENLNYVAGGVELSPPT